jgi:hypothetical protein
MVRQIARKTELRVIESDISQGVETPEIVYPESDGEPMADNTKQGVAYLRDESTKRGYYFIL